MNKNKLFFLCVISFISLFLGIKSVNADQITLYMECSYSLSEGGAKDTSKKPIYVGYTDIVAPNDDYYEIQARLDTSKNWKHIGDITGFFKFEVVSEPTIDESHNSFSAASKGNGNSCPLYMTLETYDNKKDYKPLFYNNLSKSTYCKDGPTKNTCKAIFKLNNTNKNVKINPDEDVWNIKTAIEQKDAVCSDINVDLKLVKTDLGRYQLHGLATYGINTAFTGYTNWTKYKKISEMTFDEVEKLAVQKEESLVQFNPSEEDEWFDDTFIAFKDDTYIEDACNMHRILIPIKNCVTESQIDFNSLESRIEKLYPDVGNIISKLTRYVKNPTTGYAEMTPIDASSLTKEEANELIILAETLKKPSEAEAKALEDEIKNILSGEYKDADGKSPCQATKDRATELFNDLQDRAEYFGKRYDVASLALEKLYDRIVELGATEEELKKVQSLIDEYSTLAERTKNFAKRIEENLLIHANINLGNLGATGCGVLSDSMKDFLKTILWYIRIASVALAVILSLVDFIKAAAGSDDKSMAAANKKFATRLILVAVLFLLPALLEFGLGILDISTTAGSLECIK